MTTQNPEVSAPETETAAEQGSISRGQSLAMTASSLVVAASAFLCTIVVAKRLHSGSPEMVQFLAFWSVLFGVFGVVAGIQQESVRAVGSARLGRGTRAEGRPSGARVVPVATGIGAATALVVGATSPFWAPSMMPFGTGFAMAVVCAATVVYSVHFALTGAASGSQRWYLFASLSSGEAGLRLLGVLLAAAVGLGLGGFELAVGGAVGFWALAVLCSRSARSALGERGDVPTGRLVRNILISMGSSSASAVLMIGFPALMKVSEGEHLSRHQMLVYAGLGLAISITRSPIMIPLQAFQGVFIAAFLRNHTRPVAALMKPVAVMLGIGAGGGVVAWLIGPWLFGIIYDTKYLEVITGPVLGVLTFGSAVMALLVLSGAATLALNIHRTFLSGWVLAALTALVLLFLLPMELIPRVVVALYAGPLVGFLLHLAGMVRAAGRSTADQAPAH